MAHFLLVHGSNHGAWCWRDLIPALEALGHSTEAIDLPGQGDDPTPLEDVTLDGYARAVLDRLGEPTILVAHSAGGFAITQAAEIDPANIARLVFLCAYVPAPGASLVAMLRQAPEQPLKGKMEMSPDGGAFRFKDEALTENLCPGCPPEVLDYIRAHVGWQPLAPQTTAVTFTGKGAGVPRSYILCENDRTIPPAHQEMMAEGIAPEDIHRMQVGHAPYFSDPQALAAQLDRIAAGT